MVFILREEIGKRLKILRENKSKLVGTRVSQREAAEALGITHGAYARWETGKASPGIEKLKSIVDYYETSFEYLLGYQDSKAATAFQSFTSPSGLTWSIRMPQNENEEKGVAIWKRLMTGENLWVEDRTITVDERHVIDIIHSGLLKINNIPNDNDLAEKLHKKYKRAGLQEIKIACLPGNLPNRIRTFLLGNIAADYFRETVSPGMKVGIVGGYTVSQMIFSLNRMDCQNIEIYPMAVIPSIEITNDSNSLASIFAINHFGYNVKALKIPYMSRSAMQALSQANYETEYAETLRILQLVKDVNIVFMGVGGLVDRWRMPVDWLSEMMGQSPPVAIKKLQEAGAVGDILYHFVDKSGKPVAPKGVNARICSISLDELREMIRFYNVKVVILAVGANKGEITQTAIRAGYANTLIIDDKLANRLLFDRTNNDSYEKH